jgi:hypothetical protein
LAEKLGEKLELEDRPHRTLARISRSLPLFPELQLRGRNLVGDWQNWPSRQWGARLCYDVNDTTLKTAA